MLPYPRPLGEVRYEVLQPFAQLQSVTDTAFYLNCVLNVPHGHRVDSVREFYSETLFHAEMTHWTRKTHVQVRERLTSLFDGERLANFERLVDAIYGDESEPERGPLELVSSLDDISPEEILGEAYFSPDYLTQPNSPE